MQMKKVSLKPGEKHCGRCGGYGTYYVGTHNGRGVPARPAAGVCYSCNGSGKQKPRSETKRKPLFSDAFKAQMRQAFHYIYQNEMLDKPAMLKYSTIGQLMQIPTPEARKVIDALVACKYVEVKYYSRVMSIEGTQIGIERFALKEVKHA